MKYIGTPIKVTIIDNNGNEQIQVFKSLYKAGLVFSVYPRVIKQLIDEPDKISQKVKDKLPKNVKFEYTTIDKWVDQYHTDKDVTSNSFHCDICNKTIKNHCRYTHMVSQKHLRLSKINNIID